MSGATVPPGLQAAIDAAPDDDASAPSRAALHRAVRGAARSRRAGPALLHLQPARAPIEILAGCAASNCSPLAPDDANRPTGHNGAIQVRIQPTEPNGAIRIRVAPPDFHGAINLMRHAGRNRPRRTQVRVALARSDGRLVAASKPRLPSGHAAGWSIGLVRDRPAPRPREGPQHHHRRPRPIDVSAGVLVNPPNLPWQNVAPRGDAGPRHGCQGPAGQRRDMAGLGEFHHGAGRGTRNMVYITWSTAWVAG